MAFCAGGDVDLVVSGTCMELGYSSGRWIGDQFLESERKKTTMM